MIRPLLLALATGLLLAPTSLAQAPDNIDGRPVDRRALRATPITRIVADAKPAVVNIYTTVPIPARDKLPRHPLFRLQRRDESNTVLGSGCIIDPDGYVLTNAHVIQVQAPEIIVRLGGGDEFRAELIDLDADHDIALLKIDAQRPLPTVPLGRSHDIMVGETVIAIGNPLGNETSVSVGIVSSLHRDVRLPSSSNPDGRTPAFNDFIQLDAPINPGGSGGPLLNILGEVIGLTAAIAQNSEGLAFAIPVDRVRGVLSNRIMTPRRFGIEDGMNLAVGDPGSAPIVGAITPGGPADLAGLEIDDELLAVDGVGITWEFEYNKLLCASRPGDLVTLQVLRGGEERSVRVALQEIESADQTIWRTLGIKVVDHPQFYGVWVVQVDPVGPSARLPIQREDVLDTVGERSVDSVEQLANVLRGLPPDDPVTLRGFRGSRGFAGTVRLR